MKIAKPTWTGNRVTALRFAVAVSDEGLWATESCAEWGAEFWACSLRFEENSREPVLISEKQAAELKKPHARLPEPFAIAWLIQSAWNMWICTQKSKSFQNKDKILCWLSYEAIMNDSHRVCHVLAYFGGGATEEINFDSFWGRAFVPVDENSKARAKWTTKNGMKWQHRWVIAMKKAKRK